MSLLTCVSFVARITVEVVWSMLIYSGEPSEHMLKMGARPNETLA